MKTKLIFPVVAGIMAFVFTSISSPAFSEEKEKTPLWYDKVTIGGELRTRSESQLSYADIAGGVNNDSFVLLRARFHLDVKPVDGVQIFIQPQFSRIFAQEESTIANNGDAANPNNVFDLHQGYIAFPRIGDGIVSVTLGRQELAYGEERLVGTFGWSNVGRSFDAAKIRLDWENVRLDGFFSWVQKAGGNQYFGGLYESWKIIPSMVNEPYVLILRDNDGSTSGTASLTVATFGDRFAGTFLDNKADYSLEAALQLGKDQPNSILAYAAHAAGGYTFDTALKPRLGVEYNFASGDKAGTAKQERFNNLFPTNHDKYGYIDFASWRNLHDISASIGIKPTSSSLMKFDYHLFLLPHPTDGMFRASGAVLRAGAAGASRLAGHEIDLLARYQWNKWVGFLGGYSFFKGGKFFSDTGTNGAAHFAYAQVQTNF